MIERLLERIYNKPTRDILYEFYIEKDMSIKEVSDITKLYKNELETFH